MEGEEDGLGSADDRRTRALLAPASALQPLASVLPRHCSASPGSCLGPGAADAPLPFWHVLRAAFPHASVPFPRSSSPKMTQQMRDLQLAQARKPPGPSSPNAAKRLYRNLSGKFRVNYTSFDEGSLAGRGEKEKLRKSYLVSAHWFHPPLRWPGRRGWVRAWAMPSLGWKPRSTLGEAALERVHLGLVQVFAQHHPVGSANC